MTIFVTQGRFTEPAMKRMLENPEDRSIAVRNLFAASGG